MCTSVELRLLHALLFRSPDSFLDLLPTQNGDINSCERPINFPVFVEKSCAPDGNSRLVNMAKSTTTDKSAGTLQMLNLTL